MNDEHDINLTGTIPVYINLHSLARDLVSNFRTQDLAEFVLYLDDAVAETEFTRDLIKALRTTIDVGQTDADLNFVLGEVSSLQGSVDEVSETVRALSETLVAIHRSS